MKIIRYTSNIKLKIKEKFDEYLNTLGNGDKVEFKLDFDSPKSEDKPIVKFTELAYNKIKMLVNKSNKEVGWRGTVERTGNTFLIKDILVYPQKVTGASVEVDEARLHKWEDELDDDTFNSLKFQGHSHVNMSITPSAQDRTTYDNFADTIQSEDDYFIFMIFNKSDDYYIELQDGKNNIIYYKNDITVEGVTNPQLDDWYKDAEKMVEEYTPQQYNFLQEPKKDNRFEECKSKDCKNCKVHKECEEYYYNKFINNAGEVI